MELPISRQLVIGGLTVICLLVLRHQFGWEPRLYKAEWVGFVRREDWTVNRHVRWCWEEKNGNGLLLK